MGSVLTVARGGTLNLVGAVCTQLSLLAVLGLLARVLGSGDVGRYAQCYAFLSLLGLLSLSGFRSALTRFVAVQLSDGDPGAVRGTVRLAVSLATASAAVLGAGLWVLAPQVAAAFHDDGLTTGLRLVGLALPAATFTDVALSATRGWRSMREFALIGNVLEAGVRLGVTLALVLAGAGLTGALLALPAAAWVTAAASAWALRRRLRALPPAEVRYRPRELFSFSAVSWLASMADAGLIWGSTLVLGLLADSADVGVYTVATRLVTLAVFVMTPVTAAFAPHVAHLHHGGRTEELGAAYALATSWIVRISLPAFVVLLVFPDGLLALFGEGFRVGVAVTVALALGKLVEAATGPCGLLLNMSGHIGVSMANNVAVLVLDIALTLVLVPRHGILGAAVAWGVSLTLVNLARLVQVRRLLGLLPFDASVGRGVVAGAAALLAGVGARLALAEPAELPLGVLAVLAAYAAVLAALGPSPSDREVLRALGRRLNLRPA